MAAAALQAAARLCCCRKLWATLASARRPTNRRAAAIRLSSLSLSSSMSHRVRCQTRRSKACDVDSPPPSARRRTTSPRSLECRRRQPAPTRNACKFLERCESAMRRLMAAAVRAAERFSACFDSRGRRDSACSRRRPNFGSRELAFATPVRRRAPQNTRLQRRRECRAPSAMASSRPELRSFKRLK